MELFRLNRSKTWTKAWLTDLISPNSNSCLAMNSRSCALHGHSSFSILNPNIPLLLFTVLLPPQTNCHLPAAIKWCQVSIPIPSYPLAFLVKKGKHESQGQRSMDQCRRMALLPSPRRIKMDRVSVIRQRAKVRQEVLRRRDGERICRLMRRCLWLTSHSLPSLTPKRTFQTPPGRGRHIYIGQKGKSPSFLNRRALARRSSSAVPPPQLNPHPALLRPDVLHALDTGDASAIQTQLVLPAFAKPDLAPCPKTACEGRAGAVVWVCAVWHQP